MVQKSFCWWSKGRRNRLVILAVCPRPEKKESWKFFKVVLRDLESGSKGVIKRKWIQDFMQAANSSPSLGQPAGCVRLLAELDPSLPETLACGRSPKRRGSLRFLPPLEVSESVVSDSV